MTDPYLGGAKRKKSVIKRLALAMLWLIGLGIIAVLIMVWLAYRTPGWYDPFSPNEPNVDQVAEKAQERFLELGVNAQNAPVKTVEWSIKQDEINSLIAVKMAEANGGAPTKPSPDAVFEPMVLFTPGRVTLGARVGRVPGHDEKGGVLGITLAVKTLPPDPATGQAMTNQLYIAVEGVSIGSLAVPKWVVQNRIDALIPALGPLIHQILVVNLGPRRAVEVMPAVQDCLDHIRKEEPFTPQIVLDNGRPISMHAVRVADKTLTIELGPPAAP